MYAVRASKQIGYLRIFAENDTHAAGSCYVSFSLSFFLFFCRPANGDTKNKKELKTKLSEYDKLSHHALCSLSKMLINTNLMIKNRYYNITDIMQIISQSHNMRNGKIIREFSLNIIVVILMPSLKLYIASIISFNQQVTRDSFFPFINYFHLKI